MPKEISKKQIRSARDKRRAQEKRKNIFVFGVIGLFLLTLAVFVLTRPQAQPLNATRLASDPTSGLETAKVTITEFSDYG
jgi:hypothetical protein